MSDLADRYNDSAAALEGAGATFANRNRCASGEAVEAGSRTLPRCSCGGRAAYVRHPPLSSGGEEMEVLRCTSCGNSVGPMSCRQSLAVAWRLGGWVADAQRAEAAR